jgi:hypothetical protein
MRKQTFDTIFKTSQDQKSEIEQFKKQMVDTILKLK